MRERRPGRPERPTGSRVRDGKLQRGGAWYLTRYDLRASSRSRHTPTTRSYRAGFRCAADYPWKPAEQKSEVRDQKSEAEEASRKGAAPTPPKTAISTPGKLLLDLNFDTEEDLKKCSPSEGVKVSVKDGYLILEFSKEAKSGSGIRIHPSHPVSTFVVEARFRYPQTAMAGQYLAFKPSLRDAVLCFGVGSGVSVSYLADASSFAQLAKGQYPMGPGSSFHAVAERVGSKVSFTVNGEVHLAAEQEGMPETFTGMLVGINSGAVWEIDYIRIWEALPK